MANTDKAKQATPTTNEPAKCDPRCECMGTGHEPKRRDGK